jgi:uncharacterized membrane protein
MPRTWICVAADVVGADRARAVLVSAALFIGGALVGAGCQKEQVVPTDLRWQPDIEPIIARACLGCHSQADTLKGPNAHGLNLEGYDHVRKRRNEIYKAAVSGRTMPGRMGDSLGIHLSDEERAKLGAWVKGGAPR